MLSQTLIASLLVAGAAQAMPSGFHVRAGSGISLNNQQLAWNGNPSFCLTAASDNNGAAVGLQKCSGKSLGSFWTFHDGVISTYSNSRCVDVTNGNAANGNKLQLYDCVNGNTNQQWTTNAQNEFVWNSNGGGFCMDNSGGNAAAGNAVQIWQCNGGPNQQWHGAAFRDGAGPTTTTTSSTSTKTTTTTKTSTTTSAPTSTATGSLIRWNPQQNLCASATGPYNGAPVTLQSCSNDNDGLHWTLQSNGLLSTFGGFYCLDDPSGGGDGTKLQVWTCKSDKDRPNPYSPIPNQEWIINGGKLITLDGTQLCVDNTDGKAAAGNPLQVYTCNNGPNQQFISDQWSS